MARKEMMKMNASSFIMLTLVSAAAVAACGRSRNDESTTRLTDSASAASAGSLEAPRHMERMMDGASMPGMNMPSDAAWVALRDSIRQDLIHMPDLNASQLRTIMPQHRERVMRLMQMHEGMMSSMKK
jgi:hypothetical protein